MFCTCYTNKIIESGDKRFPSQPRKVLSAGSSRQPWLWCPKFPNMSFSVWTDPKRCVYLPQFLFCFVIHCIAANSPPGLLCSVQRLHGDLLILKVDKDGVVGPTSPAETYQVFAGQRGVLISFPAGEGNRNYKNESHSTQLCEFWIMLAFLFMTTQIEN